MKWLRHFNIRNLPNMPTMDHFLLPVENTLQGLADMFMGIVNAGRPTERYPQLDTIAIRALLYRDIKIRISQFSSNPIAELVADFLQIRIYNVDYNYRSPLLSDTSMVVSQIAKGTPHRLLELGLYECGFWSYWLG